MVNVGRKLVCVWERENKLKDGGRRECDSFLV